MTPQTYPVVILVNSLAEFQEEVFVPSLVRLNLTEHNEHTKMLTYLHVNLNLQSLTPQGHIVWLHDSQTFEKVPGSSDDFWRPYQRDIYQQLPRAQEIVRAWLTTRGYQVRSGQYGLPDAIKPVRGHFECLNWIKEGDAFRLEEKSSIVNRKSEDPCAP